MKSFQPTLCSENRCSIGLNSKKIITKMSNLVQKHNFKQTFAKFKSIGISECLPRKLKRIHNIPYCLNKKLASSFLEELAIKIERCPSR